MRRLLKYTTLILMVLMLSGSVWASTYTDHITTAPNNKGDVLIFPWYMALDGGWQTKLTVINTDEKNCVVAKLIIRSFKNSEELLDFFLYLSPADVWTGIIKYDSVLGKVVIFSDDDSVLSAIVPSLVWADTTPINQPMFALTCSDDSDALGYVEVITTAVGPVVAVPTPGSATKKAIYDEYEKLVLSPTTTTYKLRFAGDLAQGSRINSLAGYMQFQNATAGLDASLQSTTLKDYGNTEVMTTGVETKIGENAINSLAEVEASITKNDIAMPYVNANDIAFHMFTFPTKLTTIPTDCKITAAKSPFFNDNTDSTRCVRYTLITYNLKEESPRSGSPFSGGDSTTNKFCYEVNFVASTDFQYAEGWAHYALKNSAGNDPMTVDVTDTLLPLFYEGAPVIPTFFYLGASGLSADYGAWTDELVGCSVNASTVITGPLVDYQYTDSVVPTLCSVTA